MVELFEAIALTYDIIVIPQRSELGTCAREFLGKLRDLGTRAGSDRVGPQSPNHEPGDTMPVVLGRAHAGIAEHEAEDVPFPDWNFRIVG